MHTHTYLFIFLVSVLESSLSAVCYLDWFCSFGWRCLLSLVIGWLFCTSVDDGFTISVHLSRLGLASFGVAGRFAFRSWWCAGGYFTYSNLHSRALIFLHFRPNVLECFWRPLIGLIDTAAAGVVSFCGSSSGCCVAALMLAHNV